MAIFTESLYMDTLGISVALIAVAVAYFKWCLTYWDRKGVYAPVASMPFGTAKNLITQKTTLGTEFKQAYEDIKSKGKKYGGYYFFGKPIFIPADIELIKQIMTKDFAHFTDHVNHIDVQTDPLTGHLFSLKGAEWKNLRTKLTPTFTSGKMKMMFQILADCSKELTSTVNILATEKKPLDIKEIGARFTTDIIGSCAFGLECNSMKDPDSVFRYYGKKVFDTNLRDSLVRLISVTIPDMLGYFKVRTFRKDVNDFFVNLVKQTVTFRETNNVIRKDFMHLLIQLKNNIKINENEVGELKNKSETNGMVKSEPSMGINELAAQCFVFFVAGYETSSTTMTYCLYELAQQPKLQQKLRDEINTVLDKHNGEFTYDGVMEMTYMDKCISETLRKYPPVPLHTRECTQTYKVPGSDLVLEKGSFVFIPAMGVQYDAEYYPEPEKFDPERFSEENKAKRHPSAWTPFGDGPRTCIGLRFGLMQTKVGLTALLKNYKLSLHPETQTPVEFDPRQFILTPHKSVLLNIERI